MKAIYHKYGADRKKDSRVEAVERRRKQDYTFCYDLNRETLIHKLSPNQSAQDLKQIQRKLLIHIAWKQNEQLTPLSC